MHENDKTDFGVIKIHNNVIASIAYLAALEIDGIARVCDDIRSRIAQALGKKTKSGAISVKTLKPEGLSLTIPVIVRYGTNIPEVALKLQERVKAAIEEGTDLSPKDIVIKIKGVEK